MRPIAMLMLAVLAMSGSTPALDVFSHKWTVPDAADWKVSREGGAEVLQLVNHRGPLPGPRRPIQFALADTADFSDVTVTADVKPHQKSLMIVFSYRDPAHFNYAHLSTDTGTKQPVHNGIFHVYGGERVRISSPEGRSAFAESERWYHVSLTHKHSGEVAVTVDGEAVPALRAVDFSLPTGKIGLGSFDETADFRNVKISGTPGQAR